MKFIVKRTSDFSCYTEDRKPCKNAFKSTAEIWDERTCTEEQFDKGLTNADGTKLWKSYGEKHTVLENGHIARKIGDEKIYAINIETLGGLIDFQKINGDIIMSFDFFNNLPIIEIYDDYRE